MYIFEFPLKDNFISIQIVVSFVLIILSKSTKYIYNVKNLARLNRIFLI